MRATDVEPDRLTAAQNAAKAFIPTCRAMCAWAWWLPARGGGAAAHAKPDDLLAAIDRFQLQRGTATGNGIMVALATLFPDAGIDIAALGGRRPCALPMGHAPEPEQKAFTPVAPGSYRSAAIIMLTDGQRTTGVDPLEAANGPPTAACASSPWAWAR